MGASYTSAMQDFSAALDAIERLVAMGARNIRLGGGEIEVSFGDPAVSYDGEARSAVSLVRLAREEEPDPESVMYHSSGG